MMIKFEIILIGILLLTSLHGKLQTAKISPLILTGTEDCMCPPQASLEQARVNISSVVRGFVKNFIHETYNIPQGCGSGEWHTVVNLDMTNPSQQCPSAWMEFNSGGVRVCKRIQNVAIGGGCDGTTFTTDRSYHKVCGRATGYQIGGSAAFGWTTQQTVDTFYLYGLSLTRGSPCQHIWTFATGLTEGDHSRADWHCPCADPTNPNNVEVPSFLWVITTFVNQEIPPTPTSRTIFTVGIHSGMESSVKTKECVAVMRTLLRSLQLP
jgi:hypothetical protein